MLHWCQKWDIQQYIAELQKRSSAMPEHEREEQPEELHPYGGDEEVLFIGLPLVRREAPASARSILEQLTGFGLELEIDAVYVSHGGTRVVGRQETEVLTP